MWTFLAAGVVLGLSAGLAPGPLLTLVVAETLRHGISAGVRVALAPLLSDLPIILLTIFVLDKISNVAPLLGIISLCGALLLLHMAYQSLRTGEIPAPHAAPRTTASLRKGVLVNALSPHPYLFWLTVGGSYLSPPSASDTAAPALFLIGFYGSLIGAKLLLATLVERARLLAKKAWLTRIFRLLAILLCLLALTMARQGLALLKTRSGELVFFLQAGG